MKKYLKGLLLLVAISGAVLAGACTTAQVQQAETEISTGLSIISGMLDGVYASAEVYCNSGQIPANTCSNLKADYMAAQTAVSAVNTLKTAVGSLDNSSNMAASTQATAAVLSAYFAIASAINTVDKQWKIYLR